MGQIKQVLDFLDRNILVGDQVVYTTSSSGCLQLGKILDTRPNKDGFEYGEVKVIGIHNTKAGWTYSDRCYRL